jgi:hypothetical protein
MDLRLGLRGQDGQKSDHGSLRLGGIDEQEYMWRSRPCRPSQDSG